MNKIQKISIILIFCLSILLRVGLALVNREANDDHMKVISLIQKQNVLPVMGKCHECFHPKFFYVLNSTLLNSFKIQSPAYQVIFVQLMNVLAGILTLLLVWKLIQEYPAINFWIKIISFALIALNPKLIAINSQSSNDSFAILFGSLALFYAYKYFQKPGIPFFILQIVFLSLALSTKINTIVNAVGIISALCFTAWFIRSSKFFWAAVILLLSISVIGVINPLTQFVVNYQHLGTPFANSTKARPLPPITGIDKNINLMPVFRPGILTIKDGFFSFKLFDLLNTPFINNDEKAYPITRTSFLTMLYADANSLHFQSWPKSWQTSDDISSNINRVIYIFALLPAIAMIIGMFKESSEFLTSLLTKKQYVYNPLFLIVTIGSLAFLILFTLLFRDFAFMKFIYILPGLLAFTWILLRGNEIFCQFKIYNLLVYGLLVFYILDVSTMIYHLYCLLG